MQDGGIPFDRQWALVDVETGKAAAPETDAKWRPALFLSSRVRDGVVEIGFPDGRWLNTRAADIGEHLFEHFRFPVELRPYGVGTRNADDHPTAINRYVPSPVHVVTTASMETLAATGLTDVASRRFRPTILVRSRGSGFPESAWLGKSIRIGTVILSATEEAKRCGMTMIAQPGLSGNPDILRAIVRQNRRNLGIYCAVATTGKVSVGDSVVVV